MAIELPLFEDTFCQLISLCSEVSPESAAGLPEEDLDLTSAYNASAGKALARLIWEPKLRHFHVDVALRAAFGKTPPETDTRLPQLRKALNLFRGTSGTANIHGYFAVPVASLPPTGGLIFSGSSTIKLRVNKSEIELTGASLSFRNADVDKIRWDLGKDMVYLDIYARRSMPVDNAYLLDAFRRVDAALDRYVLGKKTDDKASA